MKLPRAEDAIVDIEKIRDYLLSTERPIGRFKAAFFWTLGYSHEQWEQLESDIRGFHTSEDVSEVVESRYGKKYIIRANLKGPNGEEAALVSVWIVLNDEELPRFVTAYPGERQ